MNITVISTVVPNDIKIILTLKYSSFVKGITTNTIETIKEIVIIDNKVIYFLYFAIRECKELCVNKNQQEDYLLLHHIHSVI